MNPPIWLLVIILVMIIYLAYCTWWVCVDFIKADKRSVYLEKQYVCKHKWDKWDRSKKQACTECGWDYLPERYERFRDELVDNHFNGSAK